MKHFVHQLTFSSLSSRLQVILLRLTFQSLVSILQQQPDASLLEACGPPVSLLSAKYCASLSPKYSESSSDSIHITSS